MNTRQTFIIFSLLLTFTASAQLLSFDKSTVLANAPALRKTVYCANGDLVAVFTNTIALQNAFSVIRYDRDGELVWQADYQDTSLYSCSAKDVIESTNGDLIISFSAITQNSTSVACGLFRINSQGILLWEKLYSSASLLSDQFTQSAHIAEATDGSIFLSLSDINLSLNPNTEALILCRFSASGNLLWGIGFGPTPPMEVVKLAKAPAGGVHIGANSNINPNIHLIRVDSSGVVTASNKSSQMGDLLDFVTDSNNNLKALLTTNYLNWTRIVELDSVGNVTSANEATIATTSWGTDLLWVNNGYVSMHEASGGGTLLCSWAANASLTNGLSFVNTSLFTGSDFFAGTDGSIYMTGIAAGDQQTTKTRMIKTKPLLGNNFPFDGCSQTSADFTIVAVTIANPITQALITSSYIPVMQTSSFQKLSLSATIPNNCSVVSVDENLQNEFEVYPNPASDMISIPGNFSGDVMVEVLTVTGQHVMNAQMQPEGNSIKLNTARLSEGVYLVRITDGTTASGVKRFVVSR